MRSTLTKNICTITSWLSLILLPNIANSEDLVEFSVFEQVYLSQKNQAIEDKRQTNYELDRFNYKSEYLDPDDKQEVSDYNFDISISTNSDAKKKRYALNNKAYLSLIEGDYEAAIFYYEEFLNKYGSDPDILTAIGSAYHRLGDIETSKQFYSDVLLSDPDHEVALNNYIVLVGEDMPDEGIALLQNINMLHNNKIISAQLGYLYAMKHDYTSAKDSFEEAFKSDNNDIKLSYNLALSYDYLGNNRSAYLLYKQILYNSRYRNHQNLIPRNSVHKRYKVLERLIQESQGVNKNG